MMTSVSANRLRQTRFAEKQRQAGKQKLSFWLTVEEGALIRGLLAARADKTLVRLIGSDRQIAWATEIRAGVFACLKWDELSQELMSFLRKKNSAHWWIEIRLYDATQLVDFLTREMGDKSPLTYLRDEEIISGLYAEATLVPENRKKNNVSIQVSQPTPDGIGLLASEYHVPLTAFSKANGFAWKAPLWIKTCLDLEKVSADDQFVALCVELLDQGFTLRVFDEALRERIVKHDYSPLPARIIDVAESEKYGQQFRLSWKGFLAPRTIKELGDLLGGKVFDTAIYCRPSRYETLVDVAKFQGFELTGKAKQIIEQQEQKHLKRIGIPVVVNPKRTKVEEINPLALTPSDIATELLDV